MLRDTRLRQTRGRYILQVSPLELMLDQLISCLVEQSLLIAYLLLDASSDLRRVEHVGRWQARV